jgi:hypothetical protein
MRGYYEGRFRERQLYAVQAEYRAHLFWRVGAVGFASLGGVARDIDGTTFDHRRVAGAEASAWRRSLTCLSTFVSTSRTATSSPSTST